MTRRPWLFAPLVLLALGRVLPAAEEARTLAVAIVEQAAARTANRERQQLLATVALHLKAGTITVAEAGDLVELMGTLAQLEAPAPVTGRREGPRPSPAARPAPGPTAPPPPLSRDDLTGLLDAPPVPPRPKTTEPKATGTGATAEADPTAGDPAAKPVPKLVAKVTMAAELGPGDYSFVIDKGSDDGVLRLQQYRIERDGTPLCLAIVSSVQATKSGMRVLPKTWFPGNEKEIKTEDQAFLDKQPE